MADPRFFGPPVAWRLGPLLDAIGARPGLGLDPEAEVAEAAGLGRAGPAALAFFDGPRPTAELAGTNALAVLIAPALGHAHPRAATAPSPRVAFARAARLLHPEPAPAPGRHPLAAIDPTAEVDPSARIEAFAAIGPGAEIGAGAWIEPGAVIAAGVVIGAGTRVGAGAAISHALIGRFCRILPGARIGQRGFGFAPSPDGLEPMPQLGRVVIEDDVEIGANTTIDRGADDDTVIGRGTAIDNLVQIGHNVRVGRFCVIAAQTGVSGSCRLGDFVMLGGQVGLKDHLTVGDRAQAAAQSGLMRDVPAGGVVMGSPAEPIKEFFRGVAALRRLGRGETRRGRGE